MSSHSTLIKGAAILAAAGIAVRFMGAVLRIALAALMGDEGIGLYQMAYPIYSSLLAISTAGIPVAISKLVAENIALKNYREAFRVFKAALVILTATGVIITLLLLMGADFFARVVVKEPRAVYPLLAIAPAIFFVTIMSAVRGFFQGQQQMGPTAFSQAIEQFIRVAASLILAVLLLPVGLEFAAAGASAGAVFGGLAGLAVLGSLYLRHRPSFLSRLSGQAHHWPGSYRHIIGRIFTLAIPITFGSLILPLITLIDLAVVPRQLQAAGFTPERSTALYGQLTGMASSIIYFPNVVIIALSMSLVPAVAEAFALHNRGLIANRTAIGIRLTMLFSLPAGAGLFLLATPITVLLFNNAEAGLSLAIMAWSVIPLSLYITTTGIMQGLGRPIIPVLNMIYGGAVKTVLAWYLTAVPAYNIGGAALASVLGLFVAAVLNLYAVARCTGWSFHAGDLAIRPGLSTLAMSAATFLAYDLVYRAAMPFMAVRAVNAAAAVLAIGVGMAVYGMALLLAGGLRREDLALVPRVGGRLADWTERFNRYKK